MQKEVDGQHRLIFLHMESRTMHDTKLRSKDLFLILLLGALIALVAASSTGLLAEGIDSPVSYKGDDDYSILNQVKQLSQENWIWRTDRLGAPVGQFTYDYPSFFLQNPEYLMFKFWALFTKDVPVIVNLQFLMTFVFCGVSSYIVLRKMGTGYLLSFCGSIVFAVSPYIFIRGLAHYCLSACYFIPVSVYLCYLSYFNDNVYTKQGKPDIRRILLILAACACIATNGIGYYPFFTCFLLCVTILCKLLETKNIKKCLSALSLIIIICSFMTLALSPIFIYHALHGKNEITTRTITGVETYGLKTVQLFMPVFSHGIPFWDRIITEYRNHAPLINENISSYLGLTAGIGFITGLLFLFGINNNKENRDVMLFARLNVASVLFMSVGGFISLLAVLSNVYVMHGFNRISIYMMFISIATLCVLCQRLMVRMKEGSRKYLLRGIIAVIAVFSLWDQTPVLYNSGEVLRNNRYRWVIDDVFIDKIEEKLQPNDMVFQLPYHPYPEVGSVRELKDYELLMPYIHSDTLKWSFAGIKGRESDKWNKYVSSMATGDMIRTITEAGFRGIYIDQRAYTDEEFNSLLLAIENEIHTRPVWSIEKKQVFYSLYPYIKHHPEIPLDAPASLDILSNEK